MGKFTSEYDVSSTQQQATEMAKTGVDMRTMMPVVDVGQATWSAEQSAWFVKCKISQTKKWNLSVRKDNAAGRWQVNGGI